MKKCNFILLILWCVLIFIGSSFPGADVSSNKAVNFGAHKIVHLVEYGILHILALNFFKNPLVSVAFCLLYALSDEFHQLLVKGREGKLLDVGVDMIGVIGSDVALRILRKIKK